MTIADNNTRKSAECTCPPETVSPFLKWAGGKRWLAPKLKELIQIDGGKFIEPFLGSGATFFQLAPKRALLSDLNQDLVDTYAAIKADHKRIGDLLHQHHRLHSVDYYYQMRNYAPRCPYRKAARFIYLNRTCWNGLYRVNLNGRFNVPIGTKTSVVLPTDNWRRVADRLRHAEILTSDFETMIDRAGRGDVVFADPPYTIKHNLNGFIKYNECLFSWHDQERLSKALLRASLRGAFVVATNANHKYVRALYQDPFELTTVERNSILSGNKSGRGKYQELLIVSKKT